MSAPNALEAAVAGILAARLYTDHGHTFEQAQANAVGYVTDENRLDEILALIDSMEHDLTHGRES